MTAALTDAQKAANKVNKAATQVPGEETPIVDSVATQTNETGETVTVSKSELDALAARLNKLEAGQNKPANQKITEEDLPDADSIDTAKIHTPVLTKTGWAVPDAFGSNPAAPKG